MVTVSPSRQLYRFTVQYAEASSLNRILDALFRAGAEPSWLFARVRSNKRFRLEVCVAELTEQAAAALYGRLTAMPSVQSVTFKLLDPEARPVAEHLFRSGRRATDNATYGADR